MPFFSNSGNPPVVSIEGLDFQEFTSSGTWIKPDNALFIYVELVGGGGGGNAISIVSALNVGAGGGGGGMYAAATFQNSDLGVSETVIIGIGGPGGATGGSNLGTAGGNTSFGSLLTVFGGDINGNVRFGGRGGSLLPGTSVDTVSATSFFASSGAGANISARGCVNGGGGGGASENSQIQAFGTSQRHGNGGVANDTLNTKGGDGDVEGGGGAGSTNNGGGGDGGRGVLRIWTLTGR